MNRRKKQMELCRKSKELRTLKFDTKDIEKANEITKLQNEMYKKWQFFKGINEAISRR